MPAHRMSPAGLRPALASMAPREAWFSTKLLPALSAIVPGTVAFDAGPPPRLLSIATSKVADRTGSRPGLRVGALRPWLLAGVLVLLPGLASAACTVGAGGMAFGPINPLAQAPVDSTGTIVVSCAESTPYSIALVGALGGNGLYAMAGPGDSLFYGLYTDALRSLVWGDGTGGSQTVGGSADALGTTHTVHGRVPAQPLARAGAYADIITVVVTF